MKSPIKEVLKYDWLAANSLFKMGHVYTLVRHSAKAKDSPYGFSNAKEYSYLEMKHDYSYMIEYNTKGVEDDLFSIYFLEDQT